MCEHMKPKGFWKFSFWSLFENQHCGKCGAKFSVPLRRQWLVFVLAIALTVGLVWCATYLSDIPGRTGRVLWAVAITIVIPAVPHTIAYREYLRAFRRAQAENGFRS